MKNMKNKFFLVSKLILCCSFLFSSISAFGDWYYFKIKDTSPACRTQMSDFGETKFKAYRENDSQVIQFYNSSGSAIERYAFTIIYKAPGCEGENDGCIIMKTMGNANWMVKEIYALIFTKVMRKIHFILI